MVCCRDYSCPKSCYAALVLGIHVHDRFDNRSCHATKCICMGCSHSQGTGTSASHVSCASCQPLERNEPEPPKARRQTQQTHSQTGVLPVMQRRHKLTRTDTCSCDVVPADAYSSAAVLPRCLFCTSVEVRQEMANKPGSQHILTRKAPTGSYCRAASAAARSIAKPLMQGGPASFHSPSHCKAVRGSHCKAVSGSKSRTGRSNIFMCQATDSAALHADCLRLLMLHIF